MLKIRDPIGILFTVSERIVVSQQLRVLSALSCLVSDSFSVFINVGVNTIGKW